jgi:hypothetical protein
MVLDTFTPRIWAEIQRADQLALAARRAAQDGDHQQAEDLRARMEAIYEQIEAALPAPPAEE